MDRNNILGFVLIFAVIIISSVIFAPSKEERAAAERQRDSIAALQKAQQAIQDTAVATPTALATEALAETSSAAATATAVGQDSSAHAGLKDKYGVFYRGALGDEKVFSVENDVLRLRFSNKGGRLISAELKEFQTYDSLPLILFDDTSSSLGFTFFAGNRTIRTDEMFFDIQGVDADSVVLNDNSESLTFSMRLHTAVNDSLANENQYIEMQFVVHPTGYSLGFSINFVGLKDVLPLSTSYIQLEWKSQLKQFEKSLANERLGSTMYYKPLNDKVDYLSERKDAREDVKSKTQWVSFKQQFFTQVLIARTSFEAVSMTTQTPEDEVPFVKTCTASLEIPLIPGADTNSFEMDYYLGPTKYRILQSYDLDLERQIPLGWGFAPMAWINRFAVIPVFNFLEGYNLNYGIIILILTLLLKLVLFPIAYKTYMSSAKMKVLKPDVEEITKRFPKKEDALKKQQATMDLYKRAGVNPMAGCVPQLLQLPILIALFRFFPASIELRQQPFLWATDLSSYDSILNLPFEIPFYGAHVSLFTLLMTISTLIYTRINSEMMSSSQTMPGMKTMMYLMPIMFLGFFNSFASGLSYYYLLANLITFAQIFAIRRFVDEDAIRAKIAENRKKPVKKSAFAKRLEEMAKQKGSSGKK